MVSPCPPHWTFAARAAYFGDRMCPLCDHRNPAGAKYCNACAWPLHLKSCKQCDAVDHEAATNCYKCGAAYPVPTEAKSESPAANAPSSFASRGDVAVPPNVTQPLHTAAKSRAGNRLFGPRRLLVPAFATILMASAYVAYRINAASPEVMQVTSQRMDAPEHDEGPAVSGVATAAEMEPVERERTAALDVPVTTPAVESEAVEIETAVLEPRVPAIDLDAPKAASPRPRATPDSATKRVSAQQRPLQDRRATNGTPPALRKHAGARAGPGLAESRQRVPQDRWDVMQVSLASCGGDLFARIACDQRVRRHFCEGHWDKAPECASGVANDHGQ